MVRNALIVIYILAVLGFSAAARASILPDHVNYDTQIENTLSQTSEYVGQVGVIPESNTYVLDIGGRFLTLATDLDLSQFVGSNVMISGIEAEQLNSPGQKFGSVDPLPGVEFGRSVFFVLSISEVIL